VGQTQPEAEYLLPLELRVTCEDGSTHGKRVELTAREQSFDLALPAKAKQVTIDPDGTLPARVDG
jgi:hypothetical protein